MSRTDQMIGFLKRYSISKEADARKALLARGIEKKDLDEIVTFLIKEGVIDSEVKETPSEVVEKKSDKNPYYDIFKRGIAWVYRRNYGDMTKWDFATTVAIKLGWFDMNDSVSFFDAGIHFGFLKETVDDKFTVTFDLEKVYNEECGNGKWDFCEAMEYDRFAASKKIAKDFQKDMKAWKPYSEKGKSKGKKVKEDASVVNRAMQSGKVQTISTLREKTKLAKKIISEAYDYWELNRGMDFRFFREDLNKLCSENYLKVMYDGLIEVC